MQNKNIRTSFFILLLLGSLIALIIFLPCPTNNQYVIFRILIALLCGLFFPLISGTINISQLGMKAAGGIALFIFVYFEMPTYINSNDKCNEPFEYTIFLRDSDDNKIENFDGILKIEGENKFDPGTFNKSESSYLFRGIDFSLKNKEVRVELESENWVFANRKKFTMKSVSEKSTSLVVIPNSKARFSSGFVKDKFEIPNVEIYSEGKLIAKTDSRGWYSISIPIENDKTGLRVNFIKKGYLRREEILYVGFSTIKLYKVNLK